MQSGLIKELLAADPAVEVVDMEAGRLSEARADAVIGSVAALGQKQVWELLERRPRVRALVMRGDLDDASLYLLRPHAEHFRELSRAVLRRLVAPRPYPDWNP